MCIGLGNQIIPRACNESNSVLLCPTHPSQFFKQNCFEAFLCFSLLGVTSESLNKALTGLPLALSTPNAIYRLLAERDEDSGPLPPPPPLRYLAYLVPLSFNCGTLNNTFKHPGLVTSAGETHTLLSLPASLSPQMFHYLDSKGRLEQFMYKLPVRAVLSVTPSAKSYDGCQADARQPLLSWVFLLVVLGGCWRGQLSFPGPSPALGVCYANGYQTPLGWHPASEDLFLRAVSGSKPLSLLRKSAPWYQTLSISKAVTYTVKVKENDHLLLKKGWWARTTLCVKFLDASWIQTQNTLML